VILGLGKKLHDHSITQDMIREQNLGGLISRSLAKDGYGIVIHYNSPSSKDESEATVNEIIQAGGKAWSFGADLTSVDEIARLFSTAKSKGKIMIAINTAGKVLKKPILEVRFTSVTMVLDDAMTSAAGHRKRIRRHVQRQWILQ
jgi:NAD(P)-dependent dehydrogenase (short-subunit alcohol dehydrogenase family)